MQSMVAITYSCCRAHVANVEIRHGNVTGEANCSSRQSESVLTAIEVSVATQAALQMTEEERVKAKSAEPSSYLLCSCSGWLWY